MTNPVVLRLNGPGTHRLYVDADSDQAHRYPSNQRKHHDLRMDSAVRSTES
jgi:hypothetical protein